MMNFESWQSYSNFALMVRKKSRYVFGPTITKFLDAIISSGEKRAIHIPKDRIFFRAQRGCDGRPILDENEEHIADEDWPHSKERMFPIKGKVTEGRANPRGISYIYLADNRDTACAEVRPWKGSALSLGLFRIKRELKIIDCTNVAKRIRFYFKEPAPEVRENCVWDDINNALSRPINPNDPETEYVPTQIIAEVFRKEGYDGMAYKSSSGKGYNIVLFDINAVEIIGCWLVEMNDIEFNFNHTRIGYGKNLKTKTEKLDGKVIKWNRLRAKYKPSLIKILFIGESPPNLKRGRFFYEGGQLTRHTRKAFEKAFSNFDPNSTNEQFLKKFHQSGCYLDDISHLPVAGLSPTVRNYLLLNSLEAFIKRLRSFSPKYIISFVSRIDFFIKYALERSEIKPLDVYNLPYPSYKQQRIDEYINGLSEVLIKEIGDILDCVE